MRKCGRMQGGWGHRPVQSAVRPGDGRVVVRSSRGLPACGLRRNRGQARDTAWGAEHGATGAIVRHTAWRSESEVRQGLSEQLLDAAAHLGLWPRGSVRLPSAYLAHADSKGVGESLLRVVTGRHTGGLETDVASGPCHCITSMSSRA